MIASMRICPECKSVNPEHEFNCGRCGAMLVCSPTRKRAPADTVEPEPAASNDTPQPDTVDLIRSIATDAEFECKKTRAGYRVVVPLGRERKQKVHVLFNGHDSDGHDIVSFLSICAPADGRRAMALLRFNSKLTYAAFAVRTIEDKEYFVVTSNQLAATADRDELRKQLLEVAKRADAVEMKLGDGADVF